MHRLGACVERNDMACIDRELQGAEMVLRRARAALDDGSIAIERPGLVDYYRRRAREGGLVRFREVLHRPLDDCQVSLLAASRGRCDDTGWVEPPPSPVEGADTAYRDLLDDLWEDLGRGLGERRARRLVCGLLRMGERVVAEEALVVMAKNEEGELALIDVRCRDIESDPSGRARARREPEAPKRPWPPDDPQDRDAFTALRNLQECFSGSDMSCFQARAPLPGVLVRDLERRLPEREPHERHRPIDEARVAAMSAPAGARRLNTVLSRQCPVLRALPEARECTVTGHESGRSSLPTEFEGVSSGHASQARAVSALIWGRHLDAETTTSRVECPWPVPTPSGKDHVSLDLVWTRGRTDMPLLVDVICGPL